MDTVALFELLLLLGIGLITPGPNALTCFAHSGMFGPKANIKLILGMVIGFVSIELGVGLLVDALNDSNAAMTVLHWIGMVFLGAMVVVMIRFDPSTITVEQHIDGMLGMKVGIGMQYVNGKEWAFVIIMMTNFIQPLGGGNDGHPNHHHGHRDRLHHRHGVVDLRRSKAQPSLHTGHSRATGVPNLWHLARSALVGLPHSGPAKRCLSRFGRPE